MAPVLALYEDVLSDGAALALPAAARFPANDTRNRTAAVKNRDTVAGEMSSEQLAEAQKRAREWKPRS